MKSKSLLFVFTSLLWSSFSFAQGAAERNDPNKLIDAFMTETNNSQQSNQEFYTAMVITNDGRNEIAIVNSNGSYNTRIIIRSETVEAKECVVDIKNLFVNKGAIEYNCEKSQISLTVKLIKNNSGALLVIALLDGKEIRLPIVLSNSGESVAKDKRHGYED